MAKKKERLGRRFFDRDGKVVQGVYAKGEKLSDFEEGWLQTEVSVRCPFCETEASAVWPGWIVRDGPVLVSSSETSYCGCWHGVMVQKASAGEECGVMFAARPSEVPA